MALRDVVVVVIAEMQHELMEDSFRKLDADTEGLVQRWAGMLEGALLGSDVSPPSSWNRERDGVLLGRGLESTPGRDQVNTPGGK